MGSYKTMLQLGMLVIIGMTACNPERRNNADTENNQRAVKTALQSEKTEGIVLWASADVRKLPERAGQFVKTVYQGETIHILPEVKADPNAPKDEYVKIELGDGHTGWILKRLIVKASGATVIEKTSLYHKPGVLAAGDKFLVPATFVAVLETKEEWVKVKGIAEGDQWFSEGWIEKSKLKESSPVKGSQNL